VAVALAATVFLVWINGAVGIIGREDNPANLMFFAVIAVALAGSLAARLNPRGMALAMTIAAGGEFIVAFIVVALRLGASEPPGLVGVVGLIATFGLLFLVSAWSFLKAAQTA
jgi:hypothetical protein